jgi:hypothetical protein
MTDALGDGSVEAILRTTILEGCVGETRAALEAAEAARLTTDRSLRGILLGVAADEGRHAALAWRVVQWLLAERPGLASVARDMFTSSLEEPEAFDEPMTSEDVAGAHGLLDSAALSSIHSDAARLVIGPCAVALLLSLALHYHGSAWSVVDTPNVGGALIPAVVRTPGRAHRVHDFAQLGRLDLFGA